MDDIIIVIQQATIYKIIIFKYSRYETQRRY